MRTTNVIGRRHRKRMVYKDTDEEELGDNKDTIGTRKQTRIEGELYKKGICILYVGLEDGVYRHFFGFL